MKTLIIGDPHFKQKKELEGADYIEKIIQIALDNKITFIVILGDVLDTHEKVFVGPHNLAEDFFEKLSNIAPLYVLIGNHDYINNQQFLTKNHIFGPFKKWKNVFIVDYPLLVNIEDKTFVFVPYVPPGRFIEALNKLVLSEESEEWELADCIFAHQEFRGCKMGIFESVIGDEWDESYPLVISGHIHNSQKVGSNILYPGSSIQHTFAETDNKRIWIVDWSENNIDINDVNEDVTTIIPDITKIDVGLKRKKIMKMTVSKIMKYEDNSVKFEKYLERVELKIILTGTSAEFGCFRKSNIYAKLKNLNVIFSYELYNPDAYIELFSTKRCDVSYKQVLHELVAQKDELTKREYQDLFGKELI